MNIYTRYFRVISGPIMDRAIELEAANANVRKAAIRSPVTSRRHHVGRSLAPGVTALVQETGHHGTHGGDCDCSSDPVMPGQCQQDR